ncbi:translation initiation factor IF-2 [Lentinula aciculospora]|uniref:Translation initiation factor IF-2, mitochondrial n=1 Tax=Lentinula aciculospora TaxID=153920 RepID=A0A9W9DVF5_9AGAR|nr:translation initiation factor IF-2 [Lentinula aciculospora]
MLDREEAPHTSTLPLRNSSLQNSNRREKTFQREQEPRKSPNGSPIQHHRTSSNRNASPESSAKFRTTSTSSSDLWESYIDSLNVTNKVSKSHIDPKPERRGSLIQKMRTMPESMDEKNHQASRHQVQHLRKKKAFVEKKVSVDVYIPSAVSVGQLAQLLDVRLARLQRKMEQSGMGEETSYDHVLTSDYAVLLAEEFGKNPIVNDEMAFNIYPSPPHPEPSSLPLRPPVVTIMGHVDHGKTTLLDTLRSTSVAKGEAGGITQHIGAFSVSVPSLGNDDGIKSITFLDTPGHAAFSAMRARGAGVTDIIVLVVAADDGIMPQTREVINLIKKEQDKVGVVVAINKVDKPGINVEAVQKSLLAEGLQLEQYGGDVPAVTVSGKTGEGLPSLVETLSAIAEMQDLRAEQESPVHGYVLESNMHKGLGLVATVLVLRGSLKIGSHIISGLSFARVRVMNDSNGKSVKVATPGMAVIVSGWKSLPCAGDDVLQGSEADIKKAIANRERKAEIESSLVDVEAINSIRRQEREKRELELHSGKNAVAAETQTEDGPKELRLVIKADVSGSAEAVVGALQGIGNNVALTKVITFGVGDVTESDVTLAQTAGGMIVAFNVKASKQIQSTAARKDVTILSSGVIYKLMDDVRAHVIKLLPVIVEKKVTGEAQVLQIFEIQAKKQVVKVAGCRVTNGTVERSRQARVIRNGETVHEGPVETLRVIKKDVMEVRKGSECGLSLTDFSDLQAGDSIQMFTIIEKPGVL